MGARDLEVGLAMMENVADGNTLVDVINCASEMGKIELMRLKT